MTAEKQATTRQLWTVCANPWQYHAHRL